MSVIGRALLLRGVQLCEASWSATDATLLYLPNDRSTAPERSAAPGGVDDALITLNLTSGAVVSTVAYAAGLNAVSAWRPSCECVRRLSALCSAAAFHCLALDSTALQGVRGLSRYARQ